MTEEKPVLATVTDEELEKFKELQYKCTSISKMQESLVEQLTKIQFDRDEVWDELKSKYDLEEYDLNLNMKTGEITKLK